jgi:hypothetical protein
MTIKLIEMQRQKYDDILYVNSNFILLKFNFLMKLFLKIDTLIDFLPKITLYYQK